MNNRSGIYLFLGGCAFTLIGNHFLKSFLENQHKNHEIGHNFYIGIIVNSIKVKVGVVRDDYMVISKQSVTLCSRKPEVVISVVINLIDEVIRMSGLSYAKIQSIGIGTPGYIDYHKGTVLQAIHFPEWKNLDIANIIYRHTHIPTYIDNDSSIYTIYEYIHDKKKTYKDMFVLSINSGVGGGYISNNRLIRGYRGGVGEIGHMIYKPNGYRCPCGQRGCIESYASVSALVSITKKELEKLKAMKLSIQKSGTISSKEDITSSVLETYETITADTIVNAAKAGDKLALKTFKITTSAIAICCINIYKAYDPEIIILNGSLARAGDILYNYVNIFIDLYHCNINVYDDIPIIEYDKDTYLSIYNEIIDEKSNTTNILSINQNLTPNTASSYNGRQWVIQGTAGEDSGIIGAAALAMKVL